MAGSDAEARLHEAARALRAMPGERPARMRALWPDTMPEFWTAYGRNGASANVFTPRTRPSPDQIDAMDRVLLAMLALDADTRAIVWARAEGWSWSKIQKARARRQSRRGSLNGNGAIDLKLLHRAGIATITGCLAKNST